MGIENKDNIEKAAEAQTPDNKELSEESEKNSELPEKFQAVVVLGKNWREYPPKNQQEKWRLHLSLESKMSALAAGEIYKSGLTDKILFSSGKTAGAEWPSEAEAMRQFLKKKYPNIPDEAILLEDESIDTVDNAERVAPILERYGFEDIALLTVGFHLKRSEKIFKDAGITAHGLPSEEIIKKRSAHYEKFVDNFLSSKRVKVEQVKEAILRGLLIIDAKGKIPRVITNRIRGNE